MQVSAWPTSPQIAVLINHTIAQNLLYLESPCIFPSRYNESAKVTLNYKNDKTCCNSNF